MAITTQQIKLRRQMICRLEDGLDKLGFNSREVSLCKTNMQRSKMFLGFVANDIGGKFEDIEKKEFNYNFSVHKEKVLELVAELEVEITALRSTYFDGGSSAPEVPYAVPMMLATHMITSVTALEEAQGWLLMESNRND